MEKLIKENIIYVILVVVVFLGGIYAVYTSGTKVMTSFDVITQKKEEAQTKEQNLAQLKEAKIQKDTTKKKASSSGKVIYEVLGQQFSPEASFGIMFENILANITNSGVKIRAIDYNYQPVEDKILTTNVAGYNACEIAFTTVANYTQLQRFFKNIIKENYLSSIYEVYIEPYDRDKTILIAKFKVRLYTKTI